MAVVALRAGLHFINEVSCAAAADVIDGRLLAAEALLLLEFLVEAEHGTFPLAVHVSCSTAARGEVSVGGWRGELDARCWAGGGLAVGERLGRDAGYIASAAAARVDVRGADGGVGLGDVEGRHFVCFVICCVDVNVVDGGGWSWCSDYVELENPG